LARAARTRSPPRPIARGACDPLLARSWDAADRRSPPLAGGARRCFHPRGRRPRALPPAPDPPEPGAPPAPRRLRPARPAEHEAPVPPWLARRAVGVTRQLAGPAGRAPLPALPAFPTFFGSVLRGPFSARARSPPRDPRESPRQVESAKALWRNADLRGWPWAGRRTKAGDTQSTRRTSPPPRTCRSEGPP